MVAKLEWPQNPLNPSTYMEHVYNCKLLNELITYEKIYLENVKVIKAINKRFQENMNCRQEVINEREMKKNLPCDPICDPLCSVLYIQGVSNKI